MQRIHRVAMILIAAVVAGVSTIHAQVSTPSRPDADRTPGWIFTPAIGFGGAWDDNVLLVNPGDSPPGDYASPVNPSVSLDFTGKRTRFSTGYEGSVVLYRTLDELTSFQQFLRAAVEHRATERLTIFAEENLTVAPTTDALNLAGVPFYRIGSRTNAAGGGLQAALDRFTSLRGAYTLRSVDFEFDEVLGGELQGGNSHEFDVSADRALSPRLTVGAEYEFDRVTMSDGQTIDAVQGVDDRFNIQTGGVTARYLLAPHLSLSGAFGLAHLGAGLTHDARTAPAFRLGVTHQGRAVVLSAGFRRSYIPAFGFGGTFQNEEWVGNVHVPFARNRAYVDGGISWFNNDALEPGQPDLRTVWLSSKVGYRLTRWLRVEGYYSRADQDTGLAGGRLGRNQVGFQIVTARPFKLR